MIKSYTENSKQRFSERVLATGQRCKSRRAERRTSTRCSRKFILYTHPTIVLSYTNYQLYLPLRPVSFRSPVPIYHQPTLVSILAIKIILIKLRLRLNFDGYHRHHVFEYNFPVPMIRNAPEHPIEKVAPRKTFNCTANSS